MLLAGDVGGTKTRLALFQPHAHGLESVAMDQFTSAKFPSLSHIVEQFLKGKDVKFDAACFGVPGPVVNGHVRVTNLPWELDERTLAKELGVRRVRLVNDLLATAASIPGLGSDAIVTLHAGDRMRDRTVSAVIAPGTGTGQAFLCSMGGKRSEAFPAEGGHVDFGPQNGTEDALVTYLRAKLTTKRVRVEDVLCGPGIKNVYEFVRDVEKLPEPKDLAAEISAATDKPSVITKAALAKKHPICERTLEIFCHALLSQAGNLVLTYMATGGVYLGGGIPPRITELLSSPRVLESYLKKQPLQHVVQQTPLYIIKDDHAAVVGAGLIASQL